MNTMAHYFHWGFILISVANLTVILLMILVFVLAVILPVPRGRRDEP
jgi:mannose/fructose/N-acetylgalactosamine-specific phosphotransferase system component IIC